MLHYGIAKHTPLSLGVSGIVVGLIIVAVTWLEGTPPGFGTIANAIVIGVTIDVLRSFDAIDGLSGSGLPVRIGLLAAGVLLFGVGSAFYIGAGMGAGPRDSLMMVLSRRTGKRIGLVRGAMEITVLLSGLALGGIAGIGTLTLALLVGPVVELAFWSLVKLGLATPGTATMRSSSVRSTPPESGRPPASPTRGSVRRRLLHEEDRRNRFDACRDGYLTSRSSIGRVVSDGGRRTKRNGEDRLAASSASCSAWSISSSAWSSRRRITISRTSTRSSSSPQLPSQCCCGPWCCSELNLHLK